MMYFFKVLLLILCLQGISVHADDRSHSILVSIAPYEYIVKKIVGDTQKVILFVPSGSSPHFFEPSAKQVLAAGKSDVWFLMGEAFERNALCPIQEYNPKLKTIDLRNGIDLIYDTSSCCSNHGDPDPHVWMSPRSAKQQASIITQMLTSVYPEHQQLYEKNLRELISEIDALDSEISDLLKPYKGRAIMVSHPAYAYFCRDYGLVQLPIEYEGKDPSPRQLTKILEQARDLKISTVFIQTQHSSKGANLIAKEIGAKVETIDPLSDNYLDNLREISKKFFNSLK